MFADAVKMLIIAENTLVKAKIAEFRYLAGNLHPGTTVRQSVPAKQAHTRMQVNIMLNTVCLHQRMSLPAVMQLTKFCIVGYSTCPGQEGNC